MDVASGYIFATSASGLTVQMLRRLSAFDGLLKPGGMIAECDYRDIISEDFSDVRRPVFFTKNYAEQAGSPTLQAYMRTLSACGSRWYIPSAEPTPGCGDQPILYMEADSAYASGGPIDAPKLSGGSWLMRDAHTTLCSSG
jgi:hypothetical protein